MWVVDALSIAGGSVLVMTVLHLVVFWVARFLYPPQPKKVVVAPPPPPPVQQQYIPASPPPPPPSPQIPLPPQPANPPPVPPSYVESALHAQVPVVNHGPLPPPIQVGKRSENEQAGSSSG